MTNCQCSAAGFCKAHGRTMSHAAHRLCRDKPGVFGAYQKANAHSTARPSSRSRGLGDTIEKFTTATGIRAVVDSVSEKTGIDCGCKRKKDLLNRTVPYGASGSTWAELWQSSRSLLRALLSSSSEGSGTVKQ